MSPYYGWPGTFMLVSWNRPSKATESLLSLLTCVHAGKASASCSRSLPAFMQATLRVWARLDIWAKPEADSGWGSMTSRIMSVASGEWGAHPRFLCFKLQWCDCFKQLATTRMN